jgi:hypothetical protein
VVPCGGADGKSPKLRGWPKGKRSAKTIAKLARQYPDANIGVVCGLSGIVVVDIDDPSLVPGMLERFGDTPLITLTPSGGAHLWYRMISPVRSRNLRSQGLEVDIKADGGYVLVPPSFNPKLGRGYVFKCGQWADLERLPPFRWEAAAAPPSNDNRRSSAGGSILGEGQRNNALYRHLLRVARQLQSEGALLAEARRFNDQRCSPPLPDNEVVATAASVWKYRVENRIWVGSRGYVRWSAERVLSCARHRRAGDAIIVTTMLRAMHAKREEPFAVAPRAMAAAQVIPGWSEHRTRMALAAAVELGFIERVHKGGRCKGDPSLYQLASYV